MGGASVTGCPNVRNTISPYQLRISRSHGIRQWFSTNYWMNLDNTSKRSSVKSHYVTPFSWLSVDINSRSVGDTGAFCDGVICYRSHNSRQLDSTEYHPSLVLPPLSEVATSALNLFCAAALGKYVKTFLNSLSNFFEVSSIYSMESMGFQYVGWLAINEAFIPAFSLESRFDRFSTGLGKICRHHVGAICYSCTIAPVFRITCTR